jgi:hypothetical protein
MTTPPFFFLFLFLFLNTVTVTVISSTFNTLLTPAELKIKNGILPIIITTLHSVTHLNAITIVDRWLLLATRPQCLDRRTSRHHHCHFYFFSENRHPLALLLLLDHKM